MKQNNLVKIYDTGKVCISEGKVTLVHSSVNVIIECVDYYRFTKDQLIFCTVYDKELGSAMYRAKVRKSLAEILQLKEIKCLQKWQRRSERVNISILATVVETAGDEKLSIVHQVDIANISIGGIYFETRDEIKNADVLQITFKIGSSYMSLPLQIVRVEKMENDIRGYGCRITYSPPTLEAILRSFSETEVIFKQY